MEELSPESQTKTTAGNYFVGNYPPFSFWNAEGAEQARAAIAQPPIDGTPMGIYVHLPFCRRRCHFCYFRVYTGRDARQDRVTQYLDAVLQEAALYSQTPLLARPAAALRLLRRRHALVPFHRATHPAFHGTAKALSLE